MLSAMPKLHSKQQLTQPELVELLNWELAAYEECRGCHVTAVELAPPAPDWQCNWGDASIETAGALDPRKRRIIGQVLAQTREQFDVRPPTFLPRQVARIHR